MKGTILYVGNFELPDKGASANRVVSNGKLFQKLGYKVAYLGIQKQSEFSGIQVLEAERSMYVEAYPKGVKQWFLHMCSVQNIMKLIHQQGDVCMVILYNVPYILLKRVKHALRKTDIHVVYDCTEWTGVTDGSKIKKIVKRIDEYFIRTKIADTADGMLVISKRMEQAYGNKKPLLRIPPLIDIKDEIWHQELEKENKAFEFCFAGILDGNKESLDVIVEAFGKLREEDVVLRIIGVTEQEFCDFYPNGRKLLENSREKICFMGRLSHRETIRYVKHCDCYIFIRQDDIRNNAGFPTKFSESYSCCMPIIATDISDIKWYMTKRTRGSVLSASSVEAVAEAMQKEVKQGKRTEKDIMDATFHYETYEEVCAKWLKNF